jgi:hypothetical protein
MAKVEHSTPMLSLVSVNKGAISLSQILCCQLSTVDGVYPATTNSHDNSLVEENTWLNLPRGINEAIVVFNSCK